MDVTVELESLGDGFRFKKTQSKVIESQKGDLPATVSDNPGHCLANLKLEVLRGHQAGPVTNGEFKLSNVQVAADGTFTGVMMREQISFSISGRAYGQFIVFEEIQGNGSSKAQAGNRFQGFRMEDGTFDGSWTLLQASQDIYDGGTWSLK